MCVCVWGGGGGGGGLWKSGIIYLWLYLYSSFQMGYRWSINSFVWSQTWSVHIKGLLNFFRGMQFWYRYAIQFYPTPVLAVRHCHYKRVSVRPPVYWCQSQACSWQIPLPVKARIVKCGSELQITMVNILGGGPIDPYDIFRGGGLAFIVFIIWRRKLI